MVFSLGAGAPSSLGEFEADKSRPGVARLALVVLCALLLAAAPAFGQVGDDDVLSDEELGWDEPDEEDPTLDEPEAEDSGETQADDPEVADESPDDVLSGEDLDPAQDDLEVLFEPDAPDAPTGAVAPTSGVEEIKVTAGRREELLQDVPISMVALDSTFLEETDLTQFNRLQEFVPNLRITPVTDSRSTSIRIRGIGSTGVNAGVDPSVGVFIDDVYQGRAGMSVQDFLDVERVEVLRGPQGTLFGKNTAAGAIRIISQRPSYDFQSMAEGIYGDFQDYQLRASVNVPIWQDHIAARVAGYFTSRGGFATNRFDLEEVNDNGRWGLRGNFLFDITDDLSLLVRADHARTNSGCCYPDIISYDGPSALAVIGGPTFEDFAARRESDNPNDPYATLPEADPFDLQIGANRETRDRVTVGGVSGEFEYDLAGHNLMWLTAWRYYQTKSEFDGDFSVYDGIKTFTDADLDQFSSELRLTSPGGEFFDYIAGLYFYHQTQDTIDFNSLQVEWQRAVPSILLGVTGGVPLENTGLNNHKTWTGAGYADGTLNFNEQWSLTGGLRFTWERKTRVGSQTSSVPNLIDQPPLLGPDVTKDEDRNAWDISGRLILRWFPVEDKMLYASFGNGFKSGGFNQLRTPAGIPSEFEDESSYAGEIGAKTTWFEGMVTANLTGFYTYYDDFQALSFDGTTISIRNAASLQSYGVEGELFVVPYEGLLLGTLLGFNHARYIHFPDGEARITDPVGSVQDLSGKTLDNAPNWSITAFAQYEMPIPKMPFGWYTRVDYSFTSKLYLAQDLDPNLLQDPTNLLDLRIGLRDEGARWDASFWVRNVLDDRYNVVGFDVPVVSGYAGVNGPPRQFGGTLRIKF